MQDPGYWRSAASQGSPADLQFLLDASKSLLGYRVHVAYKQWLDVVVRNLRRWHAHGLIRNLRESAPAQPVAFDFGAIDLEYLTRALGVYLYIYASHKSANHRLVQRFAGKQVLYLRGYEFAVSLALGAGMAAEASSVQTLRFNLTVEKLIGRDLRVFRVLSPEETHWATEAFARCDRRADIEAISQQSMCPFGSVFLNALHWQQGVLELLDAMDHFLVYVCSVSPSALWELEQLDTDARRGRVTVVFDTPAIAGKRGILGYQQQMLADGSRFIWPRNTPKASVTPEALYSELADRFCVVTRDDFVAHLGQHRERMAASSSSMPPGQREKTLDFQFHPAIADAPLADLRDYSGWLKARIDTAIARQDIPCALLLLSDIQLRIYTTLLLGEHDETGRALAAYSGMLRAVLARYRQDPQCGLWQSPYPRDENAGLLETHIRAARDWGVTLMSCGPADRFESIHAQAEIEFLKCEASALAAVDQWLRRRPADPTPLG